MRAALSRGAASDAIAPEPGTAQSAPLTASRAYPQLTASRSYLQSIRPIAADDGKKPLRLGLILGVGRNPDAAIAKVRDLGLPSCQVFADEIAPELVAGLRRALDKYQIEATSLVVGGPGKEVWDFYQGPLTIGLVPRETRSVRTAHIRRSSDLAQQCDTRPLHTQCA